MNEQSKTEKIDNGTPTSLTIDENGDVWIPDTHNSRILHYDGEDFEVAEMQSVYYDARRSHNWRNPHKQPCELLMVRQR